jgi:hypothetical protein
MVLLIAYPIYFGFAMYFNNPFMFLNKKNVTNVLSEEIFANNKGDFIFKNKNKIKIFIYLNLAKFSKIFHLSIKDLHY